MCVIFIVNGKRPTQEMVERAWLTNQDGGGVAYREGDEVVWDKGLDKDAMIAYAASLPIPFVMHFRIASSGGVCKELTHPFPVELNTSLELSGRTKSYVLFHNGDWRDWKPNVVAALREGKSKLPLGRQWSDTRGMAWLCAHYGLGWMDFIEEKGIAFGPTDDEIFYGRTGWKNVEGVWCSNDYFSTRSISSGSSMCRNKSCASQYIDATGYCHQHRPAQSAGLGASHSPAHTDVKAGGTSAPFLPQSGDKDASKGNGVGEPIQTPLLSKHQIELAYRLGRLSKNQYKKNIKRVEKVAWKARKKEEKRLLKLRSVGGQTTSTKSDSTPLPV